LIFRIAYFEGSDVEPGLQWRQKNISKKEWLYFSQFVPSESINII